MDDLTCLYTSLVSSVIEHDWEDAYIDGRARIVTRPGSERRLTKYIHSQTVLSVPSLFWHGHLSVSFVRGQRESPSSATRCGLLVLRWLSLQRSGCCLSPQNIIFRKRNAHLTVPEHSCPLDVHVPSAKVVSVTPLFTYPTQPVKCPG